MIRVVVDTNIVVSTALPGSRLQPLVEAWKDRRCHLLVSRAIFEEYLRVLTYPKFQLSSQDIARIIEGDLLPYVEFVNVRTRVEAVPEDPADNHFLACAVDGKADLVVSGDHHLLKLRAFQGIPIVPARDFLTRLGTGRSREEPPA